MILPSNRRNALTAKAQECAANVEAVLPYLLGRGISAEVASMFTLGCVPNGMEYARRLSIPYVTPAGVVQIKYRCADQAHDVDGKHIVDSCPKYLYEAGTGTHLYNAQVLIHCADRVIITEGELDAVCVQAYTGLPAVAYPGVETWAKQKHYRLCFEGISEVIVVADGDEPGRKSAQRVAESIGLTARVVDLPDGSDANAYIASHGAGAFVERISQ